jgi:FKBP-type peptidyl-prolyl cis-trans isomerase SlyD
MRISKNRVVTLNCDIAALDDEIIREQDPVIYLHGGYDNLFPPLERALEGREIGDLIAIELPPADAYGEYDTALVVAAPRGAMPADVVVGNTYTGGDLPVYEDETVAYRVIHMEGNEVILDGNHPLAGKTLRVRCTVVGIRDANATEIAMGRALTDS